MTSTNPIANRSTAHCDASQLGVPNDFVSPASPPHTTLIEIIITTNLTGCDICLGGKARHKAHTGDTAHALASVQHVQRRQPNSTAHCWARSCVQASCSTLRDGWMVGRLVGWLVVLVGGWLVGWLDVGWWLETVVVVILWLMKWW